MEILQSNVTKKQIDNFIASQKQSLGLFAPNGFGKFTIAKFIASKILKTENISNNPNILIIKPDEKGNILVDEVRRIVAFIKLKTASKQKTSRIIIIKNAELLTETVQNLLLKPLEEPPGDVLVILCANSTQSMLSTVLSRIDIINLTAPEITQVKQYFSEGFSVEQIEKSWIIAQGRVGLFCSILNNSDHPLLEQITLAKKFISYNPYQKTIAIGDLAKENLVTFLDALLLVAESGFYNSLKNDSQQYLFWHKLRKSTLQAIKEYQAKANSKLILTKLVVNL